MKKIVLSILVCLLATVVFAQNPQPTKPATKKEKKAARRERINALLRQEEEGEIIFNKQNVFGIKLLSDGYGVAYELGKFKSNRTSTLFQFELAEKKHPKEKREAAYNQFQINSVVYGKTNNFYQFKLGVAQERVIGWKGNKNGVAVSALYGGGLSVGLLKPYFVDVQEGFRSKYPEIIDSSYNESGSAGFTVGWGDVKVKPGIYTKAAMRFDYGRLNESITAIEVGVMAEYYAGKISQIIYNKEKQFFFSAYVALLLGRRK